MRILKQMSQRFESRQWVPFPVELVFAFFADPRNLPKLMTPRMETRIEDLRLASPPADASSMPLRIAEGFAAGAGSEITVSFRPLGWMPKRASWLARIVAFEWNSYFCDEQVRGPFARFSHRHEMHAERQDGIEGTLVSDEIEYAMPFGILGLLGSAYARRQMEESFADRQRRLLRLLALEARVAATI